jgi:outer membrane protein
MRNAVSILLILFSFGNSFGQKITLEKAISIALENNLQLRQSELSEQSSEASLLQSKMAYLPSINGNWSGSRSFGTTFDNVTFSRVQQATNNSFTGLSGSITLFNGMSNYNNYKQNEFSMEAAKQATRKTENDVITNVALVYLQLLFDQENIRVSKDKLSILEQQLIRKQKEFDVGRATTADLYNLKSQIATEKLNLVNQENALLRDQMRFAQELLIDPFGTYEYEFPDPSQIMISADMTPLQDINTYALKHMPEMQEQEFRILSSQYSVRRAKSSYYPTLNLTGNLGSSYSSNGILDIQTFRPVQTPYFEQLERNFNQSLSLQLNVPIFNRLNSRIQVRNASIAYHQAQLQYTITQNALSQKIQQAWLDVITAVNKYKAVKEQLMALDEAYKMSSARYEAGALDFYSFNESLNNKSKAESDLLQAKYDFLFKSKILDLYQGRKIKF